MLSKSEVFLLESSIQISYFYKYMSACQPAKVLTISKLVILISYQQLVDNFEISEKSTDNFVAFPPLPFSNIVILFIY